METTDIQAVCDRLKARCRLIQGWKIFCRWMTPEELADPAYALTYGELYRCYPSSLRAYIKVRPPEAYGDLEPFPLEETVWHELLHIIIDKHPRETVCDAIAEMLAGS